MDSLTHIYFAHKLLTMAGCQASAAVCSLFPQIDRTPAYFHRMYGHPFFQISGLAPIGTEIHWNGRLAPEQEQTYAATRFHEERPRMLAYTEQFEEETGHRISNPKPDRLSVIIAYASHTYQDIFNNPMQGFLPYSVYPCGKWDLWSELDPIGFRTVLYSPANIKAFRAEFFAAHLWNADLDPRALVKAMVNRTAVASVVRVPPSVVDAAFESLDVRTPSSAQLRTAEEWMVEHEYLLANMIRKYSSAEASTAPERAELVPVAS